MKPGFELKTQLFWYHVNLVVSLINGTLYIFQNIMGVHLFDDIVGYCNDHISLKS